MSDDGYAGTSNVMSAKSQAYYDPLGPPTALIDSADFLTQAIDSLQRVTASLAALDNTLQSSKDAEKVRERCSVQDLLEEVAGFHKAKWKNVELQNWHKQKLKAAQAAARTSEEEEEDGLDEEERAELAAVLAISDMDNQVKAVIDEAMSSKLSILKPIPDLHYFLRKSRNHDTNVLVKLRPALAGTTTEKPPSRLDSLVYKITFQPIFKSMNLGISRTFFPTMSQTLYCLGSNTLAEIKANLSVGGNAVPTELGPEVEEEDMEEEPDEEEEDADAADAADRADRADAADAADGWQQNQRKRWSKQRRITGSVFGIEGKLYPDQGPGKTDYAKMILELIEATDWSTAARKKRQQQQQPRDASPEDEDSAFAPLQDARPNWQAGTAMHETKLGSLDLKVGEPYWYMHQGSCEHVWAVDEIRHIHPTDPKEGYPITTYLARNSEAKCRICDRDPGTTITIEDELAGESPALMCDVCFRLLHGDNSDNHVIVIPTLPEYE